MNIKDKIFLAVVIVASVLAGMLLIQSISNYSIQEKVNAAEAGLTSARARTINK